MPPRTPKEYHTLLGDADESTIKDSDSDAIVVCSANKLAAFAELVRIETANQLIGKLYPGISVVKKEETSGEC
jgi:hypothetical protein